MTEKELFEEFGVKVEIFDSQLFEDEAFYIPKLMTMFLSDNIPENQRIKVTLHELGHKGHLPHLYAIFREKFEIQANRNMIHHLMKEELTYYEDKKDFNYLVFMEKFQLKTMADEAMVKEEYLNLVG